MLSGRLRFCTRFQKCGRGPFFSWIPPNLLECVPGLLTLKSHTKPLEPHPLTLPPMSCLCGRRVRHTRYNPGYWCPSLTWFLLGMPSTFQVVTFIVEGCAQLVTKISSLWSLLLPLRWSFPQKVRFVAMNKVQHLSFSLLSERKSRKISVPLCIVLKPWNFPVPLSEPCQKSVLTFEMRCPEFVIGLCFIPTAKQGLCPIAAKQMFWAFCQRIVVSSGIPHCSRDYWGLLLSHKEGSDTLHGWSLCPYPEPASLGFQTPLPLTNKRLEVAFVWKNPQKIPREVQPLFSVFEGNDRLKRFRIVQVALWCRYIPPAEFKKKVLPSANP